MMWWTASTGPPVKGWWMLAVRMEELTRDSTLLHLLWSAHGAEGSDGKGLVRCREFTQPMLWGETWIELGRMRLGFLQSLLADKVDEIVGWMRNGRKYVTAVKLPRVNLERIAQTWKAKSPAPATKGTRRSSASKGVSHRDVCLSYEHWPDL